MAGHHTGGGTTLRDAMADRPPLELTVLQPDGGRPERSDAARNRERILCTARRLFAERGVANVSMDDIAADAQVGKGTLYRRFGDRSGLALALLDAHDADLQEAAIRGPAPLGPGAPPAERLEAFFAALCDLVEEHGELLLEAERSGLVGSRYSSPPYRAYHTHVRILVAQLDPEADAEVLAHMLLAPFGGELHRLLVGPGGPGRERLLAAVRHVLDPLVGLR
jgi:AcrR family transcriptional regulator